jgi:hypothetical protein
VKISIPAIYHVECDIRNGRYPRTYAIREVFDVEIDEAASDEAPEVIRGAYLPSHRDGRVEFSRRLHGLHLFQCLDWTRSGSGAATSYLSNVIERDFPGQLPDDDDEVLGVLPAKARQIHSNTRDGVEALLIKTASELLLVDGVLHTRAPAPSVSVELRGGAFLASGGLDPRGEITLGLPKGDTTERVTFLFDVAHHEQAKDLALLAENLVPKATLTENAWIEIDRYDVPASIHQARHAIGAALAEFEFRLKSAPMKPPRFPGEVRGPADPEASKEVVRLRRLLAMENREPDSLLQQAKDLLDSVTASGNFSRDQLTVVSRIFTLAEFASENSPDDLSLVSANDPELASFNF